MNRADVEKRAEFYTMSHYLSEWDTSNYDELIEALHNDVLPDDVIVWEVFAGYNCEELAEMMEITRNDFLNFYEQVTQ